ncbi:MAG: glycoside hydrolase [Gammaproteobacteria bacterium]|nr:MAG: glycoside hydrolase [Gammaproteobacteria bacterium]
MNEKLNFVLCWHMHQPYYREGLDGDYQLPWVYLHALKDYDDMAAHLERHSGMRVVVNFAPVLLEQLDHYATQIAGFLADGMAMQDPLLNLLAGVTPIPEDASGRKELIRMCSRANAARMIDPYPHYSAMLSPFHPVDDDPRKEVLLEYLDEQYFVDLLVWYHLAWTSHNLKQKPLVKRLIEKAGRYSEKDRRELLTLFQKTLESIIPRYRKLAKSGQIEISMTPWGHPIVPLLNDFANMKEAQPDAPMPEHARYPHGVERSRWHLKEGLRVFRHYFGFKPRGVWLSEGGVSDDALALLDELGIAWTASGEAVWHHSCLTSSCDPEEMACRRALFVPYRLNALKPRIHFRDDGLSDLIGFEYSKWHADDAVADFVGHLERIGASIGEEAHKHVVAVILDGENAWEYYPDNGFHFLDALYDKISSHEQIRPTTFSDVQGKVKEERLTHLVAGSWVYGSFSTWIGSPDKNRAWDLLVEAKQAFDRRIGKLGKKAAERATRLLAICEGSDWFWWFGDYNPSQSVSDFDRLFRLQLRTLYCELDVPPPATLDTPISHGGGSAENAGTMRRNQ